MGGANVGGVDGWSRWVWLETRTESWERVSVRIDTGIHTNGSLGIRRGERERGD